MAKNNLIMLEDGLDIVSTQKRTLEATVNGKIILIHHQHEALVKANIKRGGHVMQGHRRRFSIYNF